jgi:Zn-dependent peptidase ImmA (M78 family)
MRKKMINAQFNSPEELLEHLGITLPEEIDIEAIAQYCGATIQYKDLKGCEARILGFKDHAIIAIKRTSSRPRQRFSAAHELGHWTRDRGKVLFACNVADLHSQWIQPNPETLANRFASDLLLPLCLFLPRVYKEPITLETVRKVATTFETSLTATAIRLVEHGSFPAMLICNSKKGREWFLKSKDLPAPIWPVDEPGTKTVAFELLRGAATLCPPVDIPADEWFTHPRSGEYTIHEESVRITDEFVLSLLWWKDENQLIDLGDEEERQETRRSDWREED